MYTTEFLPQTEHWRYGNWLREQEPATLQMYFGVPGSAGLIDNLIDRVLADPDQHEFLIAKNCSGWMGTLHIAKIDHKRVEFGLLVREAFQGIGIGGDLLQEGIVWARNRGFDELYMQCLSYNHTIQHLADKYGLEQHQSDYESEVKTTLAPANWVTIGQEMMLRQRNVFYMSLRQVWKPFVDSLG